MKRRLQILLMVLWFITLFGCAYRHYLGFHGPSIRLHPAVHKGVSADEECLNCHHPDRDPIGPPTSHPQFTGCIKCHND